MLKDGKIFIGKAGDEEMYLIPSLMNRHGLIAGASGTGKTVTAKVIVESLSELGVPTFIADVKGDLSGMIVSGNYETIQVRLESMEVTDFECRKFPVHFFDVYREKGHPIRSILQDMDPVLISRILDLSDAQQGVINIVFKAAKDMDLDIIDLKDLQAMTTYVGQHASDFTLKYGTISKQSVGAIQRKLLELENQRGDLLFGMPALAIDDLLDTQGGCGIMNIIECEKLFHHPMLYSTFLLWLLDKLYRELPEVGDLEKPKIVFITQSPADIPNSVLGQLSNRIQHSLRAYTPTEIKAVKLAADSFRQNPEFNTAEVITNMKTGQALVSVLDEDGAPCIVQKTKILPPKSSMDIAPEISVLNCINSDSLAGKYEREFDPDSAYEEMDRIYAKEEEEKALLEEEKRLAKEREAQEKEEAKEAARREKEANAWKDRLMRKAKSKAENEILNITVRSAKKFLKGLLK